MRSRIPCRTALIGSLAFLIGAFAPRCGGAEPHRQPPPRRLPEEPAWERHLTPDLRMLPGAVTNPKEATSEKGVPFSEAMSRKTREADPGRQGQTLWWKLPVSLPKDAPGDWPVVLDVDESRVISGAWLDGQSFPGFDGRDRSGLIRSGEGSVALPGFDTRERGSLWSSGEGSLLLPLSAERRNGQVVLKVQNMPHLYENGFGQIRMRPATLDEIIRAERLPDGRVRILNRSSQPFNIEVHMVREDYFGVPLASQTSPARIEPGSTMDVNLPPWTSRELYKTRLWITAGTHTTMEYWDICDPARDERSRPDVLRLDSGWEWVFVPGPHAQNPPPQDGWQPAKLPHEIPQAAYSSHWMWYRNRFQIPEGWASQPAALMLPGRIISRASVLLDGKPVGDFPNWELPRTIPLPGTLEPGTSHEILIGVTDYTEALAEGMSAPSAGPMNPPARGLEGPIASTTPLGIGMRNVPELISVPAVRTDHVAIRTTLAGGAPRIDADLELTNSTGRDGSWTLSASVLARGETVLQFPVRQVFIPAAGPADARLSSPWASPRLWTPTDPWLYELRIELRDASGELADVRRERFGFREIGLDGNHFTLNGDRINLLGGSHVVLQSLVWPVRHHPYVFLRHFGNHAPSGFLSGRPVSHLADEMGYLVKCENSNLNAHHMDNYAWQKPLIWERAAAQMRALIRAQGNHPSTVMWDIGNELSFKGPGEDKKMGDLMAEVRREDPSRLVTVGGSVPLPPGAEIWDVHGWGHWSNRADYYLFHPSERPDYLAKSGIYSHRPASDPEASWEPDTKNPGESLLIRPSDANKLHHWSGKPLLFSEGHYYEGQLPVGLTGHVAYLRLQRQGEGGGLDRFLSFHALNMLATRSLSIQNIRDAGAPSSMIHVDRGIGRYMLPLAAFSHNRRTRFASGGRLQSRFKVFYDLPDRHPVTASFRLLDGSDVVGRKTVHLRPDPGSQTAVDLDFPLPETASDKVLTLQVRCVAGESGRWFYDDVPITVYAPDQTALPPGQSLSLFDPVGTTAAFLRSHKVPCIPLKNLEDWEVSPDGFLIVGSEGLNQAEDLSGLAKKIEAGGRLIVLDHRVLPGFLPAPPGQSNKIFSTVARMDGPSPLTAGLLNEDFRFWHTRQNDQLVSFGPLETPSTGMFRPHLTTGAESPLLEIQHGRGRVVFAQLNFRDALGFDPAAGRLLANMLKWSGEPPPFAPARTLLIGEDERWLSALENRLGVEARRTSDPGAEELGSAGLMIMNGLEAAARNKLSRDPSRLRAFLERGGTMLVYGLDREGAEWLSGLTGKAITFHEDGARGALISSPSPWVRGLGHGDFFPSGFGDGIDVNEPEKPAADSIAAGRISGAEVQPWTRPAFLSEIPIGEGHIIVFLIRSLERPVPPLLRVLSTVLANAGATLNPGGGQRDDAAGWTYQPIPIEKFLNWPLADSDQPGGRRGWHLGGADNDMRGFPKGSQTFRGVSYSFADPAETGGNRVIGLSGAAPKIGELPREIKGIPVNQKAERLYFLHNSAWGIPGFVYRVYYKEDREKWIPGKPDPFVDVTVKPKENIQDWWFGSAVEKGDVFLPGATVAWLGDNPGSRRSGTRFGVYQMIWDNPYPEKTVGSIDIIATGHGGEGNAFVFGITAASRKASGASAIRPALEKILPEGVEASRVFEQVDFDRYGLVLLRDGTIPAIYNKSGRILASTRGWSVEATGPVAPGSPPAREHLGMQEGQKPEVTSRIEGARKIFEVASKGSGPVDWAMTLCASPAGVRCDLTYTPRKVSPLPGAETRLQMGLKLHGGTKADDSKPNENPVRIETPGGLSTLAFDSRYTSWFRSYALSPSGITFYSPPVNAAPYAVGQRERLWWELAAP